MPNTLTPPWFIPLRHPPHAPVDSIRVRPRFNDSGVIPIGVLIGVLNGSDWSTHLPNNSVSTGLGFACHGARTSAKHQRNNLPEGYFHKSDKSELGVGEITLKAVC